MLDNIVTDLLVFFSRSCVLYTEYLGLVLMIKFVAILLLYFIFFIVKSDAAAMTLKGSIFIINSGVVFSFLVAYYFNACSFLFYASVNYTLMIGLCVLYLCIANTQAGYSVYPMVMSAGLGYAFICGYALSSVFGYDMGLPFTLYECPGLVIRCDDPVLLLYTLLYTPLVAVCSWVPVRVLQAQLLQLGSMLSFCDRFIRTYDASPHVNLVQLFCTMTFLGLNLLRLTTAQQMLSPAQIALIVIVSILSGFFSICLSLRSLWLSRETTGPGLNTPIVILVLFAQLFKAKLLILLQQFKEGKATAPGVHNLIFVL